VDVVTEQLEEVWERSSSVVKLVIHWNDEPHNDNCTTDVAREMKIGRAGS
jgi:hypothetical protein